MLLNSLIQTSTQLSKIHPRQFSLNFSLLGVDTARAWLQYEFLLFPFLLQQTWEKLATAFKSESGVRIIKYNSN